MKFSYSAYRNKKINKRKFSIPDGIRLRTVHRKDTIAISCQTNDPSAQVQLIRKEESDCNLCYMDSFQQRLSLWRQIFTLRDVILSDRMTYICNATNARGENIKMTLGVIDVEPGKSSEDYRSGSPSGAQQTSGSILSFRRIF